MNPCDLVYIEVYKRCLSQGCSEMISKDTAVQTLQKYKNNQFTKVSKLIDQSVSEAKKLGGRSLKTKNIRSATPRGFAQAVFEANSH